MKGIIKLKNGTEITVDEFDIDWSKELGIAKKVLMSKLNLKEHKIIILETPADITPRDWIRNEVGLTNKGLQVWCVRHEKNIINLDFKGQKMETLS